MHVKQQHGKLCYFQSVFQRITVDETGQHDLQEQTWTGPSPDRSRHCSMTGHYFKPCYMLLEQ